MVGRQIGAKKLAVIRQAGLNLPDLAQSRYWDDPKRTAEVIDSAGCHHTGDLARMDDEGHRRVVGRIKDMIKRGGEAIFPREIEEFLVPSRGT